QAFHRMPALICRIIKGANPGALAGIGTALLPALLCKLKKQTLCHIKKYSRNNEVCWFSPDPCPSSVKKADIVVPSLSPACIESCQGDTGRRGGLGGFEKLLGLFA